MEEYQADIDALDERVDYEILDGAINIFIFNGKQILASNIFHHISLINELEKDEKEKRIREEIRKYYPDLYPEDPDLVRQHRKILLVFSKVVRILESDSVNWKLNKINFSESSN